MRLFSRFPYFASGFAIFSMFFGAGNVVFPLVLGRGWADQLLFALLGLALTGVILPILGLISMALYDGQYDRYFSRIGHKIGFVVLCIIMILLGPFGGIPRIITLSYSAWEQSIPGTSFWIFNAAFCGLTLLMTYRFTSVVRILGYILTPLLLFFLLLMIGIGIMSMPELPTGTSSLTQDLHVMAHGAQVGYNTMDLLAALAFGSVVVAALKAEFSAHHESVTQQHVIRHVTIAGVIAGLLLALVYGGLSVLSAAYATALQPVNSEQLISVVAYRVLGEHAGFVTNAIVLLACLTTAIALAAAFADFLAQQTKHRGNYYPLFLNITVLLSFVVAFLGFGKIVELLLPVLFICYPLIIVLALCNIAYKLWGFSYVKIPSAIAVVGAFIIYYII